MKNPSTSLIVSSSDAADHRWTTVPTGCLRITRSKALYALILASAALMLPGLQAQTISVDITPAHATNRFVPRESLGAGIDRIPVAAIDHDLTPATLDRVFAAGWQPVTYRQNTDLAVEAWHWNSEGTWSAVRESRLLYWINGFDAAHSLLVWICVASSRCDAQ